ncbi:MAG TPA: FAD-dependent oxidoreductase [Pseudonocardia sp.]|jgi:oxygen-dependent protoporphyrinogen oxidase
MSDGADALAVVGSGAAGLAAAFRLSEAGHRVRLLERADRPGGRMSTVARDGFLIEEGPSGLTRGHHSILGIVRDAGLADELVPASSTIGFAERDGLIHYLDARHIVRDALRTRLVSARTKLALLRLVADLLRNRRSLDVEDLSRMCSVDHFSAEQYARQRYGDEAFEKIIDPCVRPLVIGHSEDLSAADLLYVFHAFMANQDFVAFRSGMGSYPRLMADRFDTTLGAEVISVRESAAEVALGWRDGTGTEHQERFAGVVLACDAGRAAELHIGLDPARRAFLRDEVRFRSLVHVNLAVRRAPDIPACYVFPLARHHPRLVAITLEHNKTPGRAPDGAGVVGIYPTPAWSDQLYDEPDELVTKYFIDEVEPIVPGLAGQVEFGHVARVAPAVMNSRPGYWTAMREFRRASAGDRRIQLAGDYFCTSSVNAASASGERAAGALLAAIGR